MHPLIFTQAGQCGRGLMSYDFYRPLLSMRRRCPADISVDPNAIELPDTFMDLMNLLQWPAMAVTIAAAWLVGFIGKGKRNWGFWLFLASNVMWIAWGVYAKAPALIVLQIGLAATNIRGAVKTEKAGANAERR
jgi:hypothetical protein